MSLRATQAYKHSSHNKKSCWLTGLVGIYWSLWVWQSDFGHLKIDLYHLLYSLSQFIRLQDRNRDRHFSANVQSCKSILVQWLCEFGGIAQATQLLFIFPVEPAWNSLQTMTVSFLLVTIMEIPHLFAEAASPGGTTSQTSNGRGEKPPSLKHLLERQLKQVFPFKKNGSQIPWGSV